MDYTYAIETRDYTKIEKLNNLHDPETFWDDVRQLTKAVKSDHAIKRWQCLAECRYQELKADSEHETIFVEYIDYMDAYRIYSESHKEQTMAYTDSIAEAVDGIREQIDKDAKIVILNH